MSPSVLIEQSPNVFVSVFHEEGRCPNPNRFTGSSCKRRGCPVCGGPWARNWGTSTSVNLHEYTGAGGTVAMVAITPPGTDILPWDCQKDHAHGKRGCQVDPEAADAWSEKLTENWKRLRDTARKRVKAAGLPTETLVLQRFYEPQKRGVAHLHVIMGVNTELERVAANRFVQELHRLAPEYFFGHVDRGKRIPNHACPVSDHRDGKQLPDCICSWRVQPITANDVKKYLVSYLTGRRGRSKTKPTIRENIAHPRMPRSLIWLTPRLTRQTLVNMRRLRYARWYFAAVNGRVEIVPCLKGQLLVDVAWACVRIEPKRARAPGETDELAHRRHYKNLVLMRALHLAENPMAEPVGYRPPRPRRADLAVDDRPAETSSPVGRQLSLAEAA